MISAKTHACRTDNNPYEGFEIQGDIDKVFLRGNRAVEDGKVVQEKLGNLYQEREKTAIIKYCLRKPQSLSEAELWLFCATENSDGIFCFYKKSPAGREHTGLERQVSPKRPDPGRRILQAESFL